MTRQHVLLGSGVVLLILIVVALLCVPGWLWPPPGPVIPPVGKPVGERVTIPVPKVRFTDVTDKAGIHFRHVNGATGQKLLPETMGSGVAALDYNGVGRQDLLFINSCPWPGHATSDKPPCLALYRNKGDGTFEDVTVEVGLNVTMYGMGVTVGDFDNDGYPDIFVTGIGGNRLFHNVEGPGGRRRFEDVTIAAGVGGPGGWPTQATSEEFTKWKTPIAFGSSATWLDYDGDGKLDLFVCYYVNWSPAKDLSIYASNTGQSRAYNPPTELEGVQCALYRNLGGGRFEDVSAAAGIQVFERDGTDANSRQRSVGKSLGVIVCDPDNDGWPDIVVANDTVRNFFFHKVAGPNGTRRFEEIGQKHGVAYAEGRPRGAMGIDWGEYRPGKCAILIANFANEPDTFLSLDDPTKMLFSDASLAVGLAGPSRGPLKFGAFFFDYDNDGRLDLLTCNGHLEPEIAKLQTGQSFAQATQLFWNAGGGQRWFEPVTASDSGPDLFRPLVGRGCAFLDFNGDGKLDIVLTENNGPARLLRNDGELNHHWLRLTLEGDGNKSNRSAIGAQITVEAGGMVLHRQVSAGRGYLSQSELPVTVGLGKVGKIDRVTVRWPGKDAGAPQVWTELEVDKPYLLKQGEERALLPR